MANRQKVIWYEGMCLDPHHFQQWDRHHRYLLNSNLRSVAPYSWGVSEIAVDKEALANGQFTLLRCRGIASDGLAFNIPEDDPAPLSRSIKDVFRPTDNNLLAFLAIPTERERGQNCRLEGDPGTRDTRYLFKNVSVSDDNTGADERAIGVGQTNFQVRLGNESLEGLSALKIAEIVRSPDGSFALSDRFIPPCLSLEASDTLMAITRRLVEILVAKASSLSPVLAGISGGDFASQDFRLLLALQLLNTYVPVINHFYMAPKIHPEDFYRKLLELAGQLLLFSSEGDIQSRHYPRYDHDSLFECFYHLDFQIRSALDSLMPTAKYHTIALERKSESLYTSRPLDPNLFQKCRFFLVVSGELPERRIIDEIPANVRVASPETINMVLSSFRKALTLKYVSTPPSGLPKREGAYYFQLDPSGPFWDAISKSSSFAIFIPKELCHLAIEALAL